jgi:hypothetical protein
MILDECLTVKVMELNHTCTQVGIATDAVWVPWCGLHRPEYRFIKLNFEFLHVFCGIPDPKKK